MKSDDRGKPPGQRPPSGSGFTPAPVTGAARQAAGPTASGPEGADLIERAPRARVSVPVRFRYHSIIDFVEMQAMNVSRTGMFVTSQRLLPTGTTVVFEFALSDGYILLKGIAEVVRISESAPRGMGLRFVEIEDRSRKFIDRIVSVNDEEGKSPAVPLDFGAALPEPAPGDEPPRQKTTTSGGPMRIEPGRLILNLNAATVAHFTHNPLLNIKMGGFVIPTQENVPLGTVYDIEILDETGGPILRCKGKVVAKQENRLGLRLSDPDKGELARLVAEVKRLSL